MVGKALEIPGVAGKSKIVRRRGGRDQTVHRRQLATASLIAEMRLSQPPEYVLSRRNIVNEKIADEDLIRQINCKLISSH
jgi:hypothetical protein